MTAQLNFDLENPEDVIKFNRCNKSLDLALCLFRINQLLFDIESLDTKMFLQTLAEYDININVLVR